MNLRTPGNGRAIVCIVTAMLSMTMVSCSSLGALQQTPGNQTQRNQTQGSQTSGNDDVLTDSPDWQVDPTTPIDVDTWARDAAAAYRQGDLKRAELLFQGLLDHDPDDRKAVYNLAMLNLQRAYAGLQRYLQLETRPEQQLNASRILQRLDASQAQ